MRPAGAIGPAPSGRAACRRRRGTPTAAASRAAVPWSLAAVVLAAACCLTNVAHAQVRVRVEIPYGASVGVLSNAGTTSPAATLVTGVRLDAEARVAPPLTLTVRLDPSLTVLDGAATVLTGTASPSWEPGLSEAYALLREGPVDLSAGVERLPLETARLSVPYQVDRTAKDGQRQGLLGARASLFLTPLRVRAALLERSGSLGGALSLRADLTSAQLEAHVVYLDELAVGAGASGTVGDTVVYGEAWLLSEPWRGRGALGASGYLGDALWTAEAAFAPPPGLPDRPAMPQLLGQMTIPLDGDNTLDLAAGAALMDSVLTPGGRSLAAQGSLTWITGDPDVQLELGPAVQTSELGTSYALTVRLTTYTAF